MEINVTGGVPHEDVVERGESLLEVKHVGLEGYVAEEFAVRDAGTFLESVSESFSAVAEHIVADFEEMAGIHGQFAVKRLSLIHI